jgi:ribonuclease Z
MKITFLGTGAMVPTKERNVQSIHLEVDGEGILVDCGEGTQRQMNIAGINRTKIRKILISHWHGDHVAGIVGLLQTISSSEEPKNIKLFGPKGSKEYFHHMLKSCAFELRMSVDIIEIIPKDNKPVLFFENDNYFLEAAKLRHSIPCIGYVFKEKDQRTINMVKAKKLGLTEGPDIGKLKRGEAVLLKQKTVTADMVSTIKKGKRIAFVLDTEECAGLNNLARDADVFICEATYDSSLDEKAEEYKHMTAQTVAQIASQENVKKLILTHFSQRYKTIEAIEKDAKKVFPTTVCAFDFMHVKV